MGKWKYFVFVILILVFLIWLTRLILPSQLDDVSPRIFCEDELMDLADIYYVIPKFEGIEIDKEWCLEILKKDKELAMHGVYHSYREFGEVRDKEYFDEGIDVFEECFKVEVDRFKPGQLVFTGENEWIKDEMEVDLIWNQIFHKVYHCGDSGVFPNWFVRIF